jgi:LPS O-antigen subunit length determinant protein (WzzB/FepE family)
MSANPGMSGAHEEFDVFELWDRIWRRRVFVIVITAIFAAAGVVYALLTEPTFRAESVIVEVRDDGMGGAASLANQLGGIASIVGVNLGAANSANNGRPVLESRRLTEEFVRRYVPIESLITTPGPKRTMWYAVRAFRADVLDINEDTRSGEITVSITWEDAKTASDYANKYVALANELVRSRTLDEATRNIKYLNEQIDLTNVVELRRVMYNLIETETKRLMLANSRVDYAFTVIDPAVAPEVREGPKRARMAIIFTLVGGFLGCLLALGAAAIANRRKSNPAS